MMLDTIIALRHIYAGKVNGRPLQLLLNFKGDRSLRVRVAGDGEQMIVDGDALDEPIDMGECGRTDHADVTRTLFPRLQGVTLTDVRELVWNGVRVGVTLSAMDGDAFHLWVAGDELYWGDSAALLASEWPGATGPMPLNRIEI